MTAQMLTQQELKRLLDYDPETGRLIWLVSTSNRVKAGHEAGSVRLARTGKRYRLVGIRGVHIQAHRLIWLWMTGEFPNNQIDHIDGNGINNKWQNLRAVTKIENSRNVRRRINNKSGVTGVVWCSFKKRWRAVIWIDKKQKYLGTYDSLEEAAEVRKEASKRYGFHENHGQDRPL